MLLIVGVDCCFLGQYFANIFNDYRTVAVEAAQDAKDHPLKTSVYFALLSVAACFVKVNPTKEQFESLLTECSNDMAVVGDPIRNPNSDKHIQHLTSCANAGLLRRTSFGAFSVMWIDNFDPAVDVYEARCKLLKVGWAEWPQRIVDIGVLGHWRWLEEAMIDYDVNPTEWEWPQRIVDMGVLGHWRWLEEAMKDNDVNPTEWENQ